MCPKKLDSMFEISHADLSSKEAVSTLCGSCDPPTYRYKYRVFAVKIDVFGNQNIFKDRKNSSQDCSCFVDCSTLQFLAVNQIIFLSIWMSKSGLFLQYEIQIAFR